MTQCTAARHGDVNAYSNYKCRCPEARRLKVRDWNMYVLRKMRGQQLLIPSVGTIRRIQALHAMGWRHADLGQRLGVSGAAVSQILHRDLVHVNTARAIAALYDELADQQGPSTLTAHRARARGWLPPLWWDDDTIDDPTYEPPTSDREHHSDVDPVAVERACAGDRIRLTRAERIEAARTLRRKGLSLNQIAKRLHVEQRQVSRDLDEHLEQAS